MKQTSLSPIIYVNQKNRPAVLYEQGLVDIDFWYHWKKRRLRKRDYEPVREENALSGSITRVLTRVGWNHKHWENLAFSDRRIEVLFMGPGYTPFVRVNSKFGELIFQNYVKNHKNLVRDDSYSCNAGGPPPYYKKPGKKIHFPDIVKRYDGWPPLK